ncbi:hypothetical protein [Sphingomonas sp. LT1P40]
MDAGTIGALLGGVVVAAGAMAGWSFVRGIGDVLALSKGLKETKR